MKLIKFLGTKKITITKYKSVDITNMINGKKYVKTVQTEIPDSYTTSYETYWIPADKITELKQIGTDCWINKIKVTEETLKTVLDELNKC